MRHFLLLFTFCALWLSSCQEDTSLTGAIARLEKEMDQNPTQEGIMQLVAYYNQYIKENPADEETNGRFSYRMATRHLQNNNTSAALRSLDKGVREYPDSPATPNSLFLLAETYRKIKPEADEPADLYYQSLAEAFPGHEYASKALSALKSKRTLSERIQAAREAITSDSTQQRLDTRLANELISLLQLHTSLLADDALNPGYLYETYTYANAVGQHRKAVEACEQLYTRYPSHEKAASAMFLSAFTAEDKLKDLDKAKAIYNEFLEKHPDNPFAESARMSLENLGLSAEEMLEKIRQGQGE